MTRHLKKGSGNGGDVTRSELVRQGDCREMPVGKEQRWWKRKGGGGLVVRMRFRDIDPRPSSSTMMTV